MTNSSWMILKYSEGVLEQVTELVVPGAEPGRAVSLGSFYLLRQAGDDDTVFLTATTAERKIAGGSASDGSEVVEEKWLEASLDGETFTPIGGGPGSGAMEIDYSEMATYDLGGSLSMAVPFSLRIAFSSAPSTFGDVAFALDLFCK